MEITERGGEEIYKNDFGAQPLLAHAAAKQPRRQARPSLRAAGRFAVPDQYPLAGRLAAQTRVLAGTLRLMQGSPRA
jgi:hypothetical protein